MSVVCSLANIILSLSPASVSRPDGFSKAALGRSTTRSLVAPGNPGSLSLRLSLGSASDIWDVPVTLLLSTRVFVLGGRGLPFRAEDRRGLRRYGHVRHSLLHRPASHPGGPCYRVSNGSSWRLFASSSPARFRLRLVPSTLPNHYSRRSDKAEGSLLMNIWRQSSPFSSAFRRYCFEHVLRYPYTYLVHSLLRLASPTVLHCSLPRPPSEGAATLYYCCLFLEPCTPLC